jgi:hypothetical protein
VVRVVNSACQSLEHLYSRDAGSLIGGAGVKGFSAMKFLDRVVCDDDATSAYGAIYHDYSPMGENLRQLAQMIKADVGLTIAWVEAPNNDWANHTNHSGMFNFQAVRLAKILDAFYTDLGNRGDDVVVLVMA